MNIYLDTMLWNVLFDQGIDPAELVCRLASRNARPVLSLHIFYEFAKTFRSSRKNGIDRAKSLFSYFKSHLEVGTPIVKDNMELLAAEMWALQLKVRTPETLLSSQDRNIVIEEAEKLSRGVLSPRATEFLKDQEAFALATRSKQVQHLKNRSDMKQYLRTVLPGHLDSWLDEETNSGNGIRILAEHISALFPEEPKGHVTEYASALLASPSRPFSRGVVRSDLYYNWRCAHRDSIPKDLIDDIYHILNSVYCDIYATSEIRQSDYAGFLRPSSTRVAVYSAESPFDHWIETLV